MVAISKNKTRARERRKFSAILCSVPTDRFVNVTDDETAVNFEIYEATPHFRAAFFHRLAEYTPVEYVPSIIN